MFCNLDELEMIQIRLLRHEVPFNVKKISRVLWVEQLGMLGDSATQIILQRIIFDT